MCWGKDTDYLICDSCGAICKRAGWFERVLGAVFSVKHECCLCSNAEHLCGNCLKMQKTH